MSRIRCAFRGRCPGWIALLVMLGTHGVAAQAQQPAGEPPRARQLHEVWRAPQAEVGAERLPSGPPWPITEYSTRRPSDQAKWVPGYWDHDEATGQYAWVSGVWRVPPPGRTWIAGYWAQGDEGWFRVPGFWTENPAAPYRPDAPPEPPASAAAPPGPRPSALHLWVPGHQAPEDDRLAWKPGFWTKHQKGWTWVRSTWLERPEGWVYQEGFWLKDADLIAARKAVLDGEKVAGLVRPQPNRLGGPITDSEALLRAWGAAMSSGPRAPINPDDIRLQPPPGYVAGRSARPLQIAPGSEVSPFADPGHQVDTFTPSPFSAPSWDTSAEIRLSDRVHGRFIPTPSGGSGDSTPFTIPRPAYYIGNDAPGSTFPSYSQTPAGSPSQSTYIGHSAPGTSYPSYSLTPSGLPGTSYYIGHSAPGTSYPSLNPSAVNSIGNYGVGAGAPGSTAGQIGGIGP